MSAGIPPEYLRPIMFSIEQAVVKTYAEHRRLRDKEVEEIYDRFQDFYRKLAHDKEPYEPTSTRADLQTLIDAILRNLDLRQETGLDEHLVNNPDYRHGNSPYSSIEALYAKCFSYLRKSARFWRKESRGNGYLNFISNQLSDLGA